MCEHLGILVGTGKIVKGDNDSGLQVHLLCSSNSPDLEDISILTTNNNEFKVTLVESLLFKKDHPRLNKNN